MKQVKTTDDITSLGTILGVWAHPDDETYSMAGIMAAAVSSGQTVACVTATRGEQGIQDPKRWPPEHLAEIRTKEMEQAMKELGVKSHCWLDYPDGSCKAVNQEEAVNRIADLIRKYNPDSILTFGPDGMTGHDDHKTVSRWASLARNKAGSDAKVFHAIQTREQYQAMLDADKQFNIFFNIDKPRVCEIGECDIYFVLDDSLYDRKLAAITAMPSQTEAMFKVFGNSLRDGIGIEAFIEAK